MGSTERMARKRYSFYMSAKIAKIIPNSSMNCNNPTLTTGTVVKEVAFKNVPHVPDMLKDNKWQSFYLEEFYS